MQSYKLKKILNWFSIYFILFYSFACYARADTLEVQKANIIHYLIEKVGWPNTKDSLQICVLGKFDGLKQLQKMQGMIIKKNRISIKHFEKNIPPHFPCQLIYITQTESKQNKTFIQNYAKKPVLLISDQSDFAQAGGSMNFINIKDFVGLTINFESLKASHLVMKLNTFDQITVIPDKNDLN